MRMTKAHATDTLPMDISREDLGRVFALKYPATRRWGWGPRLRARFGYFTPDDYYEALLMRLVTEGCAWLDVGCGRGLFPSNPALAQLLAARANPLVGLDPDPSLRSNSLIRHRLPITMEEYEPGRRFDLITMRMVAEHVVNPDRFVASVARALRPGGQAVVYTVNRYSPVPIITAIVPFALHRPIKRLVWQDADTFPTAFRMNTRTRLNKLFTRHGFSTVRCHRLSDCRALEGYRLGHLAELSLWRALRSVRVAYPEQCLLGIYRKAESGCG